MHKILYKERYIHNETGRIYCLRKIVNIRTIDPFEIIELQTVVYKPLDALDGQYFTREFNDFHSKFTRVSDEK